MSGWVGKTVGKVRIDRLLAHGGMAEVYLGTHLTLDRPVAVKILHSYVEEDPGLLARFQREAKVVAGLRHPNIVQVYDFDAIDNHPYIVMEYLNGPTLASYLYVLHERNEKLPVHDVARLLERLSNALDYAHGLDVIHRDIKPSNIILHANADEVTVDTPLTEDIDVILTDFGLVRIGQATVQTLQGTISGTPNYMSPEQASGGETDHRTDIYSLGVVLYEMLAGRVPFDADSTLTVIYKQINEPPPPIPGISAEVQAVIDRALAKDPDDRYQSCGQMVGDFCSATGTKPEEEQETVRATLPAPPEPATVSVRPKPVRSYALIIAALIGMISLSAMAIGAFLLYPKLSSASSETATPKITLAAPTETAPPTMTASPKTTVPPETIDLPTSEGMVKIAAATYEVGLTPADEFHAASQSVSLSDFWIDEYQITNAQFQQYLEETDAQPPAVWPGGPNHPVRGVTWEQSQAYCSWIHKRLPAEAEWEAAGRGPGQNPQLYPWGTDPTADGKVLQMPNQDSYDVGTQPFNVSPFGVYDLVGNVWEWVGEAYSNIQEGYRILHGGRFGIPQDLAYRLVVAPDDHRYDEFAGFRCASEQIK
ncbi:MAG TPA: bifunctional serine/threonine-protein kinase/formylglycine-generating enzyme family protein [Anaerolineales bacterium]|nr:bifunctional serine/threonine-protein kinase/formylglycine-generating enzyme family protein [Anaerolineales bacterium]